MTLPPWSPILPGAALPWLPVLLALLVAALGTLLTRRRWAAWAGLPGALGTLAGWAAMQPPAQAWRAVLTPRTMPEHLLLPALVVAALAAAGPSLRGRLAWWAPVLGVGVAGWWLAGAPPGRAEFWRVWAAFALGAWLLVRLAAGHAARAWAAALAGSGSLAVAGAPAALLLPGAALAAAWLVPAAAATRTRLAPPLLVLLFLAAADLAMGRLPMGGLNAADLACLLPLVAAPLAGWLDGRMGRAARWLGPAPAALAAAVLATGAAWVGRAALAQ